MTDADVAALLPLPVVIPIAGAVAAPLLARVHRRLPLVVSILSMLGATGVLVAIAARVYSGSGHVVAHYFGNWGPINGKALGIGFAADPFGMAFALVSAALGALLLLSALSQFGDLGKHELGGFACLFQLLLAAIIGSALTADLMNLFVWFEVAALASYGLTGFFLERPIALEAAFKLIVLTSIASFAIFTSVALLYAVTGALNFGQLHDALPSHVGAATLLALGLLVTGFGTKAGLTPFHGWLPDAHTAPPGAVSALFSALMVDVGVVVLARLALQIFAPGAAPPLLDLMTALGVASALVGATLALAQDDLKRLLAWDTVSQMGILVVGVATVTPAGEAGATYHLVNHALFKALMFLCAGAVVHSTGETELSKMGGLARRRPLLTGGFTIGVLAIAGIPPLNGYASLGLIHAGIEDSRQPVVFSLVLIAQAVTVAALVRAAYLGFYRRRAREYEHCEPLHAGMTTTLVALGLGCVAFGVFPSTVIAKVCAPAAAILLHPGVYAAGVLSGTSTIPATSVSFSYGAPKDLVIAAATTVVGIGIAWWYVRVTEPAFIRGLRTLHTGSVNDYSAFLALGMVVCVAALLL
jgi:multicomponent Na+:H+ antiporter subunit D